MSATRLIALIGFALAAFAALAGFAEISARRDASKVPSFAAMCGFVMRYRAGKVSVSRIAIYGFWWWRAGTSSRGDVASFTFRAVRLPNDEINLPRGGMNVNLGMGPQPGQRQT